MLFGRQTFLVCPDPKMFSEQAPSNSMFGHQTTFYGVWSKMFSEQTPSNTVTNTVARLDCGSTSKCLVAYHCRCLIVFAGQRTLWKSSKGVQGGAGVI